jgi:hypothetical protein
MSENIRPLDLDALVKQYVRLSPAIRYYQFWCLAFGILPLLLFFILAFGAGVKLLDVALALLNPSLTLNFNFTEYLTTGFTDRHQFGWLNPQTLTDALTPWIRSLLGLFVTISFVSFRVNLLTYGALFLLWVDWLLYMLRSRIPTHLEERRASGEPFSFNSFGAEGTLAGDFWILGVNLWILYFVVRLLVLVRAMSPAEQAIIREGTAPAFRVANFLRAFGIPMNIQNSSRRIRTLIFAYVGNLVGLGPLIFYYVFGALLYALIMLCIGPYFLWKMYAAHPVVPMLLMNIFLVAVVVAIPYLALLMFRAAGGRSLRASRRYLRVSLEQAQATDPRPPVLFLRSFRDDAVALPPPKAGIAFRLFNFAERNKSLDELLLEEGTSLGPVVALGNPTDEVPPYGAARAYFQHGDWQTMVSRLMNDAAAIVICVDDTESLWWEIKYVVEQQYLNKTLFLLHPKYDSANDAPEVVQNFEKVLGLAVADKRSATGRQFIGLWTDQAAQLQMGLASYFSRAHYLLMLRWFLRSKMEETASSEA